MTHTRSTTHVSKGAALSALFYALVLPAFSEQLWLSQSVSFPVADSLRLYFSNTDYTEHARHYANEEAVGARWAFSTLWSLSSGITWSQGKTEKTWHKSARPTENVSLNLKVDSDGWTFYDANRFDLKFREGERDWVVYRNIGSVTAPPLPRLPWSPRPYLTQQIYLSSRECFTGLDRFCQFRWGSGIRLSPMEKLTLYAYWQYRDIEKTDGDWYQQRLVGLSASLAF